MAKRSLSAMEVAELLARETGLSVDKVREVLIAQARLAYGNAAIGYPIPGIGKLKTEQHPERRGRVPAGPRAGQEIVIPAKATLKFRVTKAAKEMVFAKDTRAMPDLFRPAQIPTFTFSAERADLGDAPALAELLGAPFGLLRGGAGAAVRFYRLPDLRLTTGRIAAFDPMILGEAGAFSKSVAPGRYPLMLGVAQTDQGERVALAILRFGEAYITKWERARTVPVPGRILTKSAYGVDSGTGCFTDESVATQLLEADDDGDFFSGLIEEMHPTREPSWSWIHADSPSGSLAAFSSGYGDGTYTSYFGLDEMGNAAALVTDFNVVRWGATGGSPQGT
jgi:nucleoid DNA-binding protein